VSEPSTTPNESLIGAPDPAKLLARRLGAARPFLRSLPALVGLAIVALAMLAIGFVPLFDGPGYESSLAAGLVVPMTAAIVTALEICVGPGDALWALFRGRSASGASVDRPEPFDAFCRGIANGAALAAVAYLTMIVHGLRAGMCDLAGGTTLFALGPFVGALLGGAWGALAGELARGNEARARTKRRRVIFAVLLAMAGPLGSVAIALVRFYGSPMVFAYDPFAGYFSGALYDTIIDYSGLYTYRAGSAATLLASFIAALHLGHDERGRLTYTSIGRPGLLALGVTSAFASFAAIAAGASLGHFQSADSIARELGARIDGDRCEVIYPRGMRLIDAQRFTRECDLLVASGERWLAIVGSPKIRAYLFGDAGQKGRLMGASDTSIAKPWRREIYVQASGYPHPTLGHELIHVLSGRLAPGPFHVPSGAFGVLPNPGLVEGIAVAAQPREGELLPREWAKAMKDLGLLPKLDQLFALGFLATNASTAYTVSGAFVEHIRDRYGIEVVKAWYGGGDLAQLTKHSWAELETAWHAELDAIELPEAVRATAKSRFDRPAIFGRRCPHVVDGCKRRANGLLGSGDADGAINEYLKATALDPNDVGLRIAVAQAKIARGASSTGQASGPSFDEGVRELDAIARDAAMHALFKDRAIEILADLELATNKGDSAAPRYADLATRTVDQDVLRTLDVKTAAARDPRIAPAVVALLIGAPGRGPDRFRAAELLGALAAEPRTDGLASYLLGRQYWSGGDLDEAAKHLDRALSLGLPIPRVETEALRLSALVACARGDHATADQRAHAFIARPQVTTARREAILGVVAHCLGAP
jgi:hypothetical protein